MFHFSIRDMLWLMVAGMRPEFWFNQLMHAHEVMKEDLLSRLRRLERSN